MVAIFSKKKLARLSLSPFCFTESSIKEFVRCSCVSFLLLKSVGGIERILSDTSESGIAFTGSTGVICFGWVYIVDSMKSSRRWVERGLSPSKTFSSPNWLWIVFKSEGVDVSIGSINVFDSIQEQNFIQNFKVNKYFKDHLYW